MPGCFVPEWFRRFGDTPAIIYTSSAQIDRSSLAGCDDTQQVHTFHREPERPVPPAPMQLPNIRARTVQI